MYKAQKRLFDPYQTAFFMLLEEQLFIHYTLNCFGRSFNIR